MIEKAIQFAEKKHRNQKRKLSGDPYIVHPISVAKIIRENKESHKVNDLIAAAFLHDALEDTDTTEQELRKNFGNLITSLVKELTTDKKETKEKGKKEYLAEKMSDPKKMSSWALAIKLADRLDNVSDLKQQSKEFRKKYTQETKYILKSLKKRKLSQTQKKLIKQIKKHLR
ncbi:bifunctional (p)ppGpp synthetase/guanosine-3',5'-bis(diphosphate) 3'-pyrophosphohydrolase [archaeon]|jgi:(p)ppGpp synthase/HD superfamily hydrolase|nr:bifunctional (p)ppGpp synthetase/guanosine-3',5'-bis(diphosphate) 3'-pyrophosphohydrolase [archaeon]